MQLLLFNMSNFINSSLLGAEDPITTGPEWLQNVLNPLLNILNVLLVPLLIIVGTAGSIYAIVLGVNFSRAETSDKREEAKKRLINAIIGLVVIIVLLLILQLFVAYAEDIVNWIGIFGQETSGE